VTHYVTYAERCAEDTAAMHSICGLVKGHGLTSRWEQVTCPDCLAARPSGETPAPPRCAETRLTDDGTGGEFRCEGAAGHTGPHWWGAMTWSETPAPPVPVGERCRTCGVLLPLTPQTIHAQWCAPPETPAPPVPVGEAVDAEHWADLFASKAAEAERHGDGMCKFSMTPGQMRGIAAALRSPSPASPAPESREALKRLVAKWRDEVLDYPVANDECAFYAATAVRLCADELEAALHAPSVREGEA
jgi:hypothetical protein